MRQAGSSWAKTIVLVFTLCVSTAAAQPSGAPNRQLIVYHAGSLSVPFQKILEGFRMEHPGIEVMKEIAGSRDCARKISELHQPCDVFASADYAVIDNLLIPEYADWDLKFATNEMSIVYTDRSRRAKDMRSDNWYEILLDKNVAFGRADPNADPCGYRSILTMRLAEQFYGKKGLAGQLLGKNTEYIRPKEVDLLGLLEVGELDYIFIYRSVAEQHKLRYVVLPDQINLKSSEMEDNYKKVSVALNGKKPGETVLQYGASMVYGVTIPKNSPNPELAKEFVRYLMDKNNGIKVLEEMGQPSVVPSVCSQYDKLPVELRQFAKSPLRPGR